MAQALGVGLITFSQAVINHLGIGATARLTDFSGYWILLVAAALTACLLAFAPGLDPSRLVTFENFSGTAGGGRLAGDEELALLFALGALLPAYTITGFDASAHAAEETKSAAESVPRGIVRSVLVSGVAGWILLCVVVLAAPNLPAAAAQGEGAFLAIMNGVLPRPLVVALVAAIVLAQYLCGLATVTSASRMAFAFARDGGLPFSHAVRWVCPRRRSPAVAIWMVAIASILFTIHTPVYATITAVCTIFLYLSYVVPTALGAWAYGRTWTAMGPWDLGRLYRPLAVLSVAGCVVLIIVGMQPPNERSIWVVGGAALVLAAAWFGIARHRFPGPPQAALDEVRSGVISRVPRICITASACRCRCSTCRRCPVSRDRPPDPCLEDLASSNDDHPLPAAGQRSIDDLTRIDGQIAVGQDEPQRVELRPWALWTVMAYECTKTDRSEST